MPTITLLILELILCLTIQTILYKNYKTLGLYTYVIAASLISSLMSLKTINLFNYDINLGIIPFVTIFTSSNGRSEPSVFTNAIFSTTSIPSNT